MKKTCVSIKLGSLGRQTLLRLLWLQMLLPLMAQPALAQSAAVQDAYTLLNQGLVNQAIPLFEQAVQSSPQSVQARLGLALAYEKAGRIDEAFAAYQPVIDLDPTNRTALLRLGILGGYRVEWQDQGIAALTQLLELNPTDLEARSQRGLLYSYQGRLAAAIADYEIVLQANPTPETLVGAAQAYAYNGNYERSLALFERYQSTGGRIEGNAATAYALALRETGNSAEAVQILERELNRIGELNGTTIRMRAELAVNYAAIGQVDRALLVLEPLRGRRDSRMILARSLIAMGRYSGDDNYTDQAIPLFKEILAQEQDYLTVAIGREIADVLTGFPQIEARAYALEIYRQLLQQQPNDRSLQIAAAVLERDFGLISEVELRDQLEVSLQPLPADLSQQSVIARSLVRLENPDPSLLPYYTYLAEAGVPEPRLYYRIAQMQVQQGDYVAAEASLQVYVDTSQDEFAAFYRELLLAEVDRRQGNLEASADRYEAMIASNPADNALVDSALQGLAGIRQAQGRLPEAVALYDQLIARNPQDGAKVLGRTSLAYRAGLISEAQAQAVLNQWLAVQPVNNTPPELYSLVAALPARAEREALYVGLLENNPDSTGVQIRYVEVLAERDPDAAEAYVNQLVAQNPENPDVYLVQGLLAQDRGRLRQAAQALETAVALNPNHPDTLAALGGVRFQQRRYDQAIDLYNQVLAIDPTNRSAQVALVDLEVVQGRRLGALEQLDQFQQQQQQLGVVDPALAEQQQRIEEGFLQQRGFQPPWERY